MHPHEPEVTHVDQFLEDLIVNPIQIHDLPDDFNDLGTIDLTNLANDDTPEPTPPTIGDKDTPRPLRALHVPIPRTRCKIPGKMTHPTAKTSQWPIMNTSNNKSVNGNVAVNDDVAVPDIATTAGPNHPRANLNKKTNGKASGGSHIPGRANQDMHWCSTVNREITKQKCIDSAKANDHSPGKGPSHSEGISLSQMTPSQTMARTIEISKVNKGKDRTFSPASPDGDVEPAPPIPKTAIAEYRVASS